MLLNMFARLSTGIKMLLILSAALMPLGVIAVFVSIEFAQTSRLTREAEVRLIATERSRRLTSLIAAGASALRDAIDDPERFGRVGCQTVLSRMRTNVSGGSYAIFDQSGAPLCTTPAFVGERVAIPTSGTGTEARLLDDPARLRYTVAGPARHGTAAGEISLSTLLTVLSEDAYPNVYGMKLRQGETVVRLTEAALATDPLGDTTNVSVPVAGGQLQLLLSSPPMPVRALELLLIALPILMWLAAGFIGWLVVDRLVLRPLGQLQQSVMRYGNKGGELVLPVLTTPSTEIRALAQAFTDVTGSLTKHEAELEDALLRQTKLTREVHHRVKNNLQVVSSLINLHSRGATDPAVGEAYASIQRRVDALAVVHRNLYAGLEESHGVGLRPLLGELTANLRATAPPAATALPITLELIPAFASQDIAVPIAFLATELVELAMTCHPEGSILIRLVQSERSDQAIFSIEAPGLATDACRNHSTLPRANRVLEGLSRQLRAPLERDDERGLYSIRVPVIPSPEQA